MTSTSLGYSQTSIAGFLPRSELDNRSLMYEDSLTSYPVLKNGVIKSPLLTANEEYYSKTKFGKRKNTIPKLGLTQIKKMINILNKM